MEWEFMTFSVTRTYANSLCWNAIDTRVRAHSLPNNWLLAAPKTDKKAAVWWRNYAQLSCCCSACFCSRNLKQHGFAPIYVRNVEKYVRDRNACHSPSMRHIVNVRQIHIHTAHICILYATFTDFTRATKKHIARQSRLEKISNDFELLGKIPVDR